MATNIKYRLEAESSKWKDVHRLDILQKDYTGTVNYKKIGAGKIRLHKKNGGKIHGTSVTVNMQSDTNFEFADFFQYDNSKHSAKLYKNNVCVWSGFLNVENYSEPYRNPPYDVQLVFTDGLARLKNSKWGDMGYSSMFSRLDILKTCLNTLGLGLGFSIAIDLYEDSMDTSRAMLAQVYNQSFIFNEHTLYEVIEKLLPLGASITQKNNRWLIRRNKDDAEKTHLLYNQIGEYEGTEAGETVLNLGPVGADVWPHGMPNMDMVHAWKNALIKYNYGKKQSFLLNYNFGMPFYSKETERLIYPMSNSVLPSYRYNIPYWNNPSSIDVRLLNISGQPCLKLVGCVSIGTEKAILQTIPGVVNTVNAGGNFIFSFKYCVIGGYYVSFFSKVYPLSVTVKLKVKLTGSGQTYYLTTEGWVTSDSKIEIEAKTTVGEFTWTDAKICTNNIPVNGDISVELYQISYKSGIESSGPRNIEGIHFTEIRAYTSEFEKYPDPEEVDLPILENAFTSDNNIEVMPVDSPDIINGGLYYQNSNFTLSGSEYQLTRLWRNNGGDNVSLKTVIRNQLTTYHEKPLQRITSDWRGENLNLNSIVTHSLNNNRKYFVESGYIDILEDVCHITFEEIPETATDIYENSIWILDDGVWGDVGEIWIDTETWNDGDTGTLITFEFTGHGKFELPGINIGDTIETLPVMAPMFNNGLYEDAAIISNSPHIVNSTIYYKTSPLAVQSYEVKFNAIVGGVYKQVRIIITLEISA